MRIIRDVAGMQETSDQSKVEQQKIGLVPTMGSLHEGHLSLIREGRRNCDQVIVSIFVNPIQFNEKSDFESYPREDEKDIELLEKEGVHILFAPDEGAIYPDGFQTEINVRELSKGMCGAGRPGHFKGVATVVAKLFNIIKPDIAIFGEKDYQQLAIIRRMVKDLNYDIEILGMPVVREDSGLAMSSRNERLSLAERNMALSINCALKKGESLFMSGEREGAKIIWEALNEIDSGVDVEYLDVRDPESLSILSKIKNHALLAIAARVGNTRLIDNTILKEKL